MPAVAMCHLMQAALRRLAACAMVLALATPAWAQVGRDQAVAAAQRQTGGRVLAVERVESSSGPMWRVKVVTPQGEVRVVLIQADDERGMRSDVRHRGAQGADTGDGQPPQRGRLQRNHQLGRGG